MSGTTAARKRLYELNITDQGYKVKVVRLGFDFACNPICFVDAKVGLESQHRTIGKVYPQEELAHLLGTWQRKASDTLAWSHVRDGMLRMAHCVVSRQGLWALRGDRIHGFHV